MRGGNGYNDIIIFIRIEDNIIRYRIDHGDGSMERVRFGQRFEIGLIRNVYV